MSIEYIRDYYGVPARIGGRVFYEEEGVYGTIVGVSGSRLKIRLDGEKYADIYHPTWKLKYNESEVTE